MAVTKHQAHGSSCCWGQLLDNDDKEILLQASPLSLRLDFCKWDSARIGIGS